MAKYFYKFQRGGRVHAPASLTIIAVTLAVTLAQFFTQGVPPIIGPVGGSLGLYLPDLWNGEWWRMLSVSLVHGGPFHLFMNLLTLWMLGRMYEPVVGITPVIAIYVAGVVVGSSTVALLGTAFTVYHGASAGIYGLFGAIIGHVYSHLGSVRAMWESPVSRELLVMLGLNIAISFMPGVSLLGHVGGLTVGLFAGYLIERSFSGRLAIGEKLGGVMLAAAVIGIAIYATRPQNRGAYWLARAMNRVDCQLVLTKITEDGTGEYRLQFNSEPTVAMWLDAARELRDDKPDIDASELYLWARDSMQKQAKDVAEAVATYAAQSR